MKSSRLLPFVLGCFLTFGAFALQSAVAQGTPQELPKGIPFGKDQGGIYDDGSYIYVVKSGSTETLMISKNSVHSDGVNGSMIPVAFKFSGTKCEPVRSKDWKP